MSKRARTTISVDAKLFDEAQKRAKLLGYTDFSSYLGYLVEKDVRERAKHVLVREEPGKPYADPKRGRLHRLVEGMRGAKATGAAAAIGTLTWFLDLPPAHHMLIAVTTALMLDATDGKMILLGGLRLW